MTDTTRDLLISLASHMAYMQGQLEARHELDDPEDYYWYRESVLLRQKVTDALTDEPAVPEGREPGAVTGQPNWRGLCAELVDAWLKGDDIVSAMNRARAVLARWGNLKASLTSSPPADGEVADRAAELLQRQVLVPVAVPGEQYHEDMGAVTWWRLPVDEPPWVGTPNDWDWPGYHTHFTPAPPVPVSAHALPLPEVSE